MMIQLVNGGIFNANTNNPVHLLENILESESQLYGDVLTVKCDKSKLLFNYKVIEEKNKMSKNVYYKVTNNNGESFTTAGQTNKVTYKENKYVFSPVPGKYLFVFDSLENAKNFKKNQGGKVIWECECQGVEPTTRFDMYKEYQVAPPPKGTVLAYGVKLTKKIGVSETLYDYGTKFEADLEKYILIRVNTQAFTLVNAHTFNRWTDGICTSKSNMGITLDELKAWTGLKNLNPLQ